MDSLVESDGLYKKMFAITPCPKPRMTQRDRFARRPCVLRYRAFKDACRDHGVWLPEGGAEIIFLIELPKSWSKKKKESMVGQPHQLKPDLDNLLKGLFDAVLKDDSVIWWCKASKIWHDTPGIIIRHQATERFVYEH